VWQQNTQKKTKKEREKNFRLSVVHACVFLFSSNSVGKCLWRTPVFMPLLFLYCAQPQGKGYGFPSTEHAEAPTQLFFVFTITCTML